MDKIIKVAMIGLDTSHSVTFPKYMIDRTLPSSCHVVGLQPTRCLRFETPFQNAAGLHQRQIELEKLGVLVTEDFDMAVADCDAIMLEINDPSCHLEYFRKCVSLGKPIFIDKPFADSVESAQKIIEIAQKNKVRFCTASALRFREDVIKTVGNRSFKPEFINVWGSLGAAPEGTSYIIWYGIHSFEIANAIMGKGAKSVSVSPDEKGYVCHIDYTDGRRAIVELCYSSNAYGFCCRAGQQLINSSEDNATDQVATMLNKVIDFFNGGDEIVPLEESLEIMAMLEAADLSVHSGKRELIQY